MRATAVEARLMIARTVHRTFKRTLTDFAGAGLGFRFLGRAFLIGLGGSLAGNRQQHFALSGRRLARLLALVRLRRSRGSRAGLGGDAALQRVHQADHIVTGLWLRRRRNALAVALLVDEFGQRGLVMILKFRRFEMAGFLLHDVLREIEHVL